MSRSFKSNVRRAYLRAYLYRLRHPLLAIANTIACHQIRHRRLSLAGYLWEGEIGGYLSEDEAFQIEDAHYGDFYGTDADMARRADVNVYS